MLMEGLEWTTVVWKTHPEAGWLPLLPVNNPRQKEKVGQWPARDNGSLALETFSSHGLIFVCPKKFKSIPLQC